MVGLAIAKRSDPILLGEKTVKFDLIEFSLYCDKGYMSYSIKGLKPSQSFPQPNMYLISGVSRVEFRSSARIDRNDDVVVEGDALATRNIISIRKFFYQAKRERSLKLSFAKQIRTYPAPDVAMLGNFERRCLQLWEL